MALSQSQVRARFIKANPGKSRDGGRTFWYRCVKCGIQCGRSVDKRIEIPGDLRMEVDHRIPWSAGGSDELWNLQPLCRKCNRSKSNNPSRGETYYGYGKAVVNGGLGEILRNRVIRNNTLLNSFGIGTRDGKAKRKKRKR